MSSDEIAIEIRDPAVDSPTLPAVSRLAAVDRPVLAHVLSFLDARSLTAVCEATQVAKVGSQPPGAIVHRTYTPPMTRSKASSAVIANAANADELWIAAFDRDYSAYLRQGWLREKRSAKRHYLEQVAIAHRRYVCPACCWSSPVIGGHGHSC
jgi:hypothetical protein